MDACCFTGHRPKYFHFNRNESHPDCLVIRQFLRTQSEYLVCEKGVTHFYSGGAIGVDTWAMEELIALQQSYPALTVECVMPFAGMVNRFLPQDRERFERIRPHLSDITVLNDRYSSWCMQQRNEYMVDHSKYVIAVWNGEPSGTANTVQYAKKRRRKVFYMAFE